MLIVKGFAGVYFIPIISFWCGVVCRLFLQFWRDQILEKRETAFGSCGTLFSCGSDQCWPKSSAGADVEVEVLSNLLCSATVFFDFTLDRFCTTSKETCSFHRVQCICSQKFSWKLKKKHYYLSYQNWKYYKKIAFKFCSVGSSSF